MARTDTLGNFLTDVAEAIRTKEGTTETIPASEFDTRISNLSGGGKYAPKHITFFEFDGNSLDYELENLDTSNIVDMDKMFSWCRYVKNLDVTNFNTANVTRMQSMFDTDFSLTSLDVSNFDFTNVIDCGSMFDGCIVLSSIKFGAHDAPALKYMNKMFYECKSLTELDLSGFKANQVTTLYATFYDCSKLEKLNLSGLDTTNVTSTTNLFYNCPLKTLIIDNPVVFKITSDNSFQSSGIKNGTCLIYVPDNLVDAYKADTYWGPYASQIKPISEYSE